MVALAVLGLVAVGSVETTAAARGRPVVLQPTTHRSADERFELFVDPSQRHGSGAGRYRMSLDGELVWAAELPFTFFDARVTRAGEAVGYAYSDGLTGAGDVALILLGADGAIRWQQTFDRKPGRVHAPRNPWYRGLYLDEARGLLVVREADPKLEQRAELWKCRSLATGELQRRFDVHDSMEEPELASWSTFAEFVTGTDLVLSHWVMSRGGHGGRFCLSDPEGEVVWQLDRRGDYETSNERGERRQRALDGGAVLGVGPGPTFALWFASSDERVEFEVVRGAQGAWQVLERSRLPWLPESAKAIAELPEVALHTLASIPLQDGTRARVTPTAVDFRSDGRVLVADTRVLRVYEPDGALISEARLQWWNWLGETLPSEIHALDDGRIFVAYSVGHQVVFDADGTCVKVLGASKGADVEIGNLWWCDGETATLRDDSRILQLRLERDGDGRWLERVRWPTSANDDRILLVSADGWDEILSLYDPLGTPLRVVRLPARTKLRQGCAAWHDHRIAVATEGDELFLYSDAGTAVGRAKRPSDAPIVRLGFSPDGSELRVIDARGTLQRLKTP